jgi:integrase
MSDKRVTVWVQEFQDRSNLVLQWHDPETGGRKSRTAGTDDRGEAEKLRADLEYELSHGKYAGGSNMGWERFRELFENEYVSALRPNTQRFYQNTFDSFEELCHPSRLSSISQRTVSVFAAEMRKHNMKKPKSGMATSSIKNRLQFLRTALRWAEEQDLIAKCPRFPRIQVLKRKPQPIPVESFERLVAKSPDDQMSAYLFCGWLAGLRLSEAALLERYATEEAPYIDWARNRVVIPAAFGKSKEDAWVPLDPLLRQVLEQLPDRGKNLFHFVKKNGLPITTGTLSGRVLRLAKRAGVKLSMHSLRKGFGCRYAGKVPAQVLQKLMRHHDIKMTMDYYANVDDAVEEAVLGVKRNGSRNSKEQDQPRELVLNDVRSMEVVTTDNGGFVA